MNPSLLALLAALIAFPLAAGADGSPTPVEPPRNLIFMLGDGMGPAQVKAYRLYADNPATHVIEPLPMDALLVGAVATDSIVLECAAGKKTRCTRDPYGFTDSASSATSYATGRDTVVERISMDLAGEVMRTILEDARVRGKATGLVATSEITHASPAAFAAHVEDRDQMADIADQYFDRQWNGAPMVDILLGGGLKYLQREDRDLVSEFRKAGYQIALDRQQLFAQKGDRLLGIFASEGLPHAWDLDSNTPSLADMTTVALRTLNRNSQGFFLLVEGSQIDWASHDNSVPGVISEMEDFVSSIQLALDFARRFGDTLVIITGDHETGGMGLGINDVYRWDPRPLRGLKVTPEKMTAEFLSGEGSLSSVVSAHAPFELSEVEIKALDESRHNGVSVLAAITSLFNRRTLTGWSSPGHTGVDVPLYVYGPGSERFRGVMENEVLGQVLKEVFLPATE